METGARSDVEAPDRPAVEELHRLYSQNVYRFTYRRILDIASAQQITNDVFRLAWHRNALWDPKRCHGFWSLPKSWSVTKFGR